MCVLGSGSNHKDAASVRASHHIPAACGVYYFEIRVVSKGRDGYMGIGLSCLGVNLNRLPGWEKNSYGYHADDGCLFSSSATGQTYGPTFTTGDVVGCGLNFVSRSIFFTKNGINLGTAVSDLPVSPVVCCYMLKLFCCTDQPPPVPCCGSTDSWRNNRDQLWRESLCVRV